MDLFRPRLSRPLAVLALTAATGLAAVAATPAAQAAKTKKVKVDLTVHCGLAAGSQSALTGTYRGGPFGRGKVSGTITAPTANVTFKTSKGTATLYASGKLTGRTTFAGSWHWTGGTGAYKGIRGSGRISGTVDCQPWTFKGTAAY
jgi:hypothetical protein